MDEEELNSLFPDPLHNPSHFSGFVDHFWDIEEEGKCGMGVGMDIPDFLDEEKEGE